MTPFLAKNIQCKMYHYLNCAQYYYLECGLLLVLGSADSSFHDGPSPSLAMFLEGILARITQIYELSIIKDNLFQSLAFLTRELLRHLLQKGDGKCLSLKGSVRPSCFCFSTFIPMTLISARVSGGCAGCFCGCVV